MMSSWKLTLILMAPLMLVAEALGGIEELLLAWVRVDGCGFNGLEYWLYPGAPFGGRDWGLCAGGPMEP